MNADIFISFASQDRKVANILCTALESRGFGCWISSRNIQPGENFQVSIVQAIRRARIMLLVFTENSNKSEEMTKELALASQQKLIVIPLRVEDVTPNEAFSYEFATRQWIDFFADWEFAMDQLSLRIASAIGDPAAEADAAAAAIPAPALAKAPAPEARKPPTEAPKATVQPSKASAPVESQKKPAATPPAATVHAPAERTKRPLAGLALAGAAVAVAVAVGLVLNAPKPKAPDIEPKVAILASATLMPTPPAAEEPVAEPAEVPKAKAAPKRKAPKVQRQVEEEIPY